MRTHPTRWAAAAALFSLAVATAQAAPAAAPLTRPYIAAGTVIVFPFENNTMQGGKDLAEALSSEVKAGITAAPGYSVASFYPQSPLLQRALTGDKSLTKEDVDNVVNPTTGAVDPARAATVAMRMGGRYALLGSIEAAEVQPTKADVTVTVQLLDTFTGTPAKTAGVTGTATAAANAPRDAALMAAAKDAAKRALAELGFSAAPAPAAAERQRAPRTQEQPRRSRSSYWLPLGALLGILVAGVK
jgi:hypothetical protein